MVHSPASRLLFKRDNINPALTLLHGHDPRLSLLYIYVSDQSRDWVYYNIYIIIYSWLHLVPILKNVTTSRARSMRYSSLFEMASKRACSSHSASNVATKKPKPQAILPFQVCYCTIKVNVLSSIDDNVYFHF